MLLKLVLKKEKNKFKNNGVLAFAPFAKGGFFDSAGITLSRLPFSDAEIRNLNGKIFIGNAATKQTFLNHLSQFNIVHLATHAVVNDSADMLSFIAFSPNSNTTRKITK